MNSLTELNAYVNDLTLEYTDQRLANVTFDRVSAVNQSQIVDEGFTFLPKLGIEITEVINSAVSQPYYQIDISNLTGATLTWPTLPSGVTATTPSTGVYRVSGIGSKEEWDQIKQPTISLPSNFNGLYTYSSVIGYFNAADGNLTQSWTTSLFINDITFLTTPIEQIYSVSSTTDISNTPQIVNVDTTYPGATWTMQITPSDVTSISNWTTTGTGGTFTVSVNKEITIVGTRSEVNSRLSGLQLVSNSIPVSFVLSYRLTNNLSVDEETVVQNIVAEDFVILGELGATTVYFVEDAASTSISTAPLVADREYDGSGNYTYTVYPNDINAIVNISTTGSSGTSTFNPETATLTITGNRSEINSRLPTLTIKTGIDYSTDFVLFYKLVTPRDDEAIKLQSIICSLNDTEITNMSITRTYLANQSNEIFSSDTPIISDFDTVTDSYTISFSSALGLFGFDNDIPVENLTFTGTRAQCNAKFSTVKFWPNANTFSNGTFRYIQQKLGETQVDVNVSLNGLNRVYSGSRVITFTSSQTFTPTYADFRYGKISRMLIVGGGGGGQAGGIYDNGQGYGGSGGGAGKVIFIDDSQVDSSNSTDWSRFSLTTYNIVVGGGGAGSVANSNNEWWTIASAGQASSAFGWSARGGHGGGDNLIGDNYLPASPADPIQPGFSRGGSSGGLFTNLLVGSNEGYAGAGGFGPGGGGATSTGFQATSEVGGTGGTGVEISYFSVTVGGGGGGAASGGGSGTGYGLGGIGGGGRGGSANEGPLPATPNTGGGGGAGWAGQTGSLGGSGLIKIHITGI